MKHLRAFALAAVHMLLLVGMAMPLASVAQTTTPSTTPGSIVPQENFIPLNPVPGLIEAGNAPTLPAFFNGLYKLCIGVAATIAVLQIMRGGFKFMVGKGSVSKNEEAKSLIQNSILGLLLVLSPAILFGIINPKILNLELDVSGIRLKPLEKLSVDNASTQALAGSLQSCGAPETTSAQKNCLVTVRSAASASLLACTATGLPQVCKVQAQSVAQAGVAGCVPTLTKEQNECVAGGILADTTSSKDTSTAQPKSVTGTILRTGTFSTEAALDTFIGQCSAVMEKIFLRTSGVYMDAGKAYTSGCVKTCSPAGQGACDAKGCSQYRGYCGGVTHAFTHESAGKPVPEDYVAEMWNEFNDQCSADGGKAYYTYTDNGPEQCVVGPNAGKQICRTGDLFCKPQ